MLRFYMYCCLCSWMFYFYVAVLEGISRFIHLINAHIVRDLMEVLRSLLAKEGMKSLSSGLQCIVTVFQALVNTQRLHVL